MQVFLTEWLVTLPCKPAFFTAVEKFADFIFSKRTSHVPHLVIWFSLMFDCAVKGGIWFIHLQMNIVTRNTRTV